MRNYDSDDNEVCEACDEQGRCNYDSEVEDAAYRTQDDPDAPLTLDEQLEFIIDYHASQAEKFRSLQLAIYNSSAPEAAEEAFSDLIVAYVRNLQ